MARHAAQRNTLARTTARIAAMVGVAAAGAAAATPAFADTASAVDTVRTRSASLGHVDPQTGAKELTGTVGHVTAPVEGLKPNPLAGTGVDPLDNGLGTQVGDFKPLSSKTLTGPVAQAQSVGSVPGVGQAAGLLR
ncbi:hypothetical protein ACICHK_24925 [Streptomyces sp. AHU1]|uniref:hypothetical protein n=1 Tax=Streptomyces sp. AHU1 TaxID=3377215 RepID=UPI003877E490